MSDKYTYPDTEVLKNKFNVRDTLLLHAYERKYVTPRILELAEKPLKGDFDLKHLQKIHKHIFQDIYSWAGKIRETDIARVDVVTNKTYEFCLSHRIDGFQNDIFNNLKKKNYLKGLDKDQFARGAAETMSEINTLHPFREGNGRTQREFMRELALNAGWELNFDNISQERMVEASIEGYSLDYRGFEDIIKESLRPMDRVITQEAPLSSWELKRVHRSKETFNEYAKEAISDNGNKWNDNLDEKIIGKMLMKKNIDDQTIISAMKNSPSMAGISMIDQTIKIRTLMQKVKREHPELTRSRGIER